MFLEYFHSTINEIEQQRLWSVDELKPFLYRFRTTVPRDTVAGLMLSDSWRCLMSGIQSWWIRRDGIARRRNSMVVIMSAIPLLPVPTNTARVPDTRNDDRDAGSRYVRRARERIPRPRVR